MEISVEGKVDLVSDPNYPSFEVLLDVAAKLLESFEKRWQDLRPIPNIVASVELSHPTRDDPLGPFYRAYVEFILRRVVHDLGNSVSGINSLSDYHLRSGVSDPGLEESLTLIRESAELSRELLLAVGDLLQPADAEEELVEVGDLIAEAGKFISLLLPKSIKFETGGTEQNRAVISLLRGDFLRKMLALVAMDVNEARIPTGSIELVCTRDEKNVQIHYRSALRSNSSLRERAPALLANLSRSTKVDVALDTASISLTMTFPISGRPAE